jgi:hypothetical protein
MSSNPAPRQEGWIERTLYSLLCITAFLGTLIIASLALTLLPTLFVAWNVENEAPWWVIWTRQTVILGAGLFVLFTWTNFKESRAQAWQWRKAGYPEIEVHVHWLGQDEIAEQLRHDERDDESLDLRDDETNEPPSDDFARLDTLLRFVSFPEEAFLTIEKILDTVMSDDIEVAMIQGFDEVLLFRFPGAKPPAHCLQMGAQFEMVSKQNSTVEGTGQITALRLN